MYLKSICILWNCAVLLIHLLITWTNIIETWDFWWRKQISYFLHANIIHSDRISIIFWNQTKSYHYFLENKCLKFLEKTESFWNISLWTFIMSWMYHKGWFSIIIKIIMQSKSCIPIQQFNNNEVCLSFYFIAQGIIFMLTYSFTNGSQSVLFLLLLFLISLMTSKMSTYYT